MSRPKKGFAYEAAVSESTTWLTPPWVYKSLGEFDLDPCGHPMSPTATRRIYLPTDGRDEVWAGRVWLNPPYGHTVFTWLEKLGRHGCGTALLPSRTETQWFQKAVKQATAVLFLEKRIAFLRPDGTPVIGNPVGSVLLAYGAFDAERLRTSAIRGWWVRN